MNENKTNIIHLTEANELINEDRIQKLIVQKYPEEIINFALKFAKATMRGSENSEIAIKQNHYIPWIAEQAKLDPEIMKDKNRLDAIISWIRNTGFNKINTNIPFNQVYQKAVTWLNLKNKDISTGQSVVGGIPVLKYSDGYQWIKSNSVDWCINAGAANGWCLDQQKNADIFTGSIIKEKSGYFLVDGAGNPDMAVQYDSRSGTIDDYQGRFNKPVSEPLFIKSLDLLKKFPVIKNIHGHRDTFWVTFSDMSDVAKQKFLNLPNLNLSIETKVERSIALSQEEINTLTPKEKLLYGYPLTQKEISSLPLETRLAARLPITDREKENLTWEQKIIFGYLKKSEVSKIPIELKLEHDILLTTKDIRTLNQPIKEKIRKIAVRNLPYKELFIQENNKPTGKNAHLNINDDFEGFEDYYMDEDALHLKMTEEEYDEYYSGLDEYQRAFRYYDTNDYYFQDWDEEEKYMHHYLSEENINRLKEMARRIGVSHNYDFSEEGQIKKFIENNFENSEKILSDYMMILDDAMSQAKAKEIKEVTDSIKFKYSDGYLDLPWKELWNLLKDKEINKFIDLKDMEINGELDLENSYYDTPDIKDETVTELNDKFEKNLDDVEFTMGEHPDYFINVQKFNEIISGLKFESGDFEIYAPTHQGHAIYKKNLPQRDIYISKMNFVEQKAEVYIVDFKDKKKTKIFKRQKGWIHFDSIINYVQQYSLFKENELRKAIQSILKEDYRYQYNKTVVPSNEVSNAAKNALNVVNSNKLIQSTGSNEGSGLEKAKSLINKEPVTHAQLKRMKAFFDNNASVVARERTSNKNINNSAIIQSWELWGGDIGRSWTERELRKIQSSNQTSKEIRNSDMIARDNRIMSTTNTRTHR